MEDEDDPLIPDGMEVGNTQTSHNPPNCHDPITFFPTTGQPVSDSTLKDMLLSLRVSLQADMLSCIHGFQKDLKMLGRKLG